MKLSWYLISFSGLIVVFVVCYALLWVLWEWLWLSVPIWIAGYLLYRKYGIIGKEVGIRKTLKKIAKI